jgi:hypothetical protein
VTAVLHEMTPLSWVLFAVLLATALLLLGCVAAGFVLWVRGFRTVTVSVGATFDEHCDSAGVVDRREGNTR